MTGRRTLIATAHWDTAGEEQLLTRALAGALALGGPVEIAALRSGRSGGWRDGPFAVHGFGPTEPERYPAYAAMAQAMGLASVPEGWRAPPEVPRERWERLAAMVSATRPDLLVLAGLHGRIALDAMERAGGMVAVAPLQPDPGTRPPASCAGCAGAPRRRPGTGDF